jgi:hypothetical protein
MHRSQLDLIPMITAVTSVGLSYKAGNICFRGAPGSPVGFQSLPRIANYDRIEENAHRLGNIFPKR